MAFSEKSQFFQSINTAKPAFEFLNIKSGRRSRRGILIHLEKWGDAMPTSDARIEANRKNAAKSSGPKTAEGKGASRRNSLKHGLTGAGVVLVEADSAEVARRSEKFAGELCAVGEVGEALARRAALHSVRMERAVDQQTASLTAHVRQVEADFVAPEGLSDAEAEKLKAEAVRIAMFDASREATLARRYEAEAERGFYKALKQLRQMELQAEELIRADDAAQAQAAMGSFLEARQVMEMTEE